MVEGKPLKTITAFVLPVIMGSILQNLYSMADTAIVGKFIGDSALAAVGATSLTFSIIVSLTYGFMSGFSIIAGQKVGARDYEGLGKVYTNGLVLVLLISVAATVGLTLCTDSLLTLMKTPDELREEAGKYIRVIYMGISTTLLYNFFSEMFRAIGNSKKPFIYLAISSGVNIILDLFFVCVLNAGVAGAALATVIAQAVSVVLCFISLSRSSIWFRFSIKEFRFDKGIMKECARLGIPTCFLNGVISCGVLVLQIYTNSFGVEYIAAASAASRIFSIYNIPLTSYGSGLSVYVAQNFGAGQYDRIKSGVKSTSLFLFAYSTVMFAVSFFVSKYIIRLFISDTPTVVEWGSRIITVSFMGHYALSFLINMKCTLNALGRPLMPTLQGFADVALRIVAVCLGTKYFGFWGIVFGDFLTWTLGAVIFIFMLAYEDRRICKKHGFSLFVKKKLTTEHSDI